MRCGGMLLSGKRQITQIKSVDTIHDYAGATAGHLSGRNRPCGVLASRKTLASVTDLASTTALAQCFALPASDHFYSQMFGTTIG